MADLINRAHLVLRSGIEEHLPYFVQGPKGVLALYLILVGSQDDVGRVRMERGVLADALGVSVDTVRRGLRWLTTEDAASGRPAYLTKLEKRDGRGYICTYQVLRPEPQEPVQASERVEKVCTPAPLSEQKVGSPAHLSLVKGGTPAPLSAVIHTPNPITDRLTDRSISHQRAGAEDYSNHRAVEAWRADLKASGELALELAVETLLACPHFAGLSRADEGWLRLVLTTAGSVKALRRVVLRMASREIANPRAYLEHSVQNHRDRYDAPHSTPPESPHKSAEREPESEDRNRGPVDVGALLEAARLRLREAGCEV